MARRTNKDKQQEAAQEAETQELMMEDVGTVTAEELTEAEDTEAEDTEAEDTEAEGTEAESSEKQEIDAEIWTNMTPQQKLEHQKAKARAAANKGNKRVGQRKASGEETIGSVACQAIRDGKTNDEVLLAVFERFPNAKTSIASVTWYRNSLKSAGENIKSSREIVAERNKAAAAAGEGDDGVTEAPATGEELSAEDQEALEALGAESELSGEDLEGLLE